jgi:hypothetical protein
MQMKALDRLMFEQGQKCFFCNQPLAKSEASIEHLIASANGGGSNDENIVACCKSINALLGSKSVKEKLRVVLNQKGPFKCPNGMDNSKPASKPTATAAADSISSPQMRKSLSDNLSRIVTDLRSRGTSKPRTLAKLASTIDALFQKTLSDQAINSLIQQLQNRGIVACNEGKVSYTLPLENV